MPGRIPLGDDGFLQPGLLLQGWVIADHGEETTVALKLRRAELHLKGELAEGMLGFGLMIDPAKLSAGPVSILQDLFLTLRTPGVDISLGQFKTPVSWEGSNSSSRLLFPERSSVARKFGDKRDLGVRFSKTFRYVGYSAGLFNGAGPNKLESRDNKDLALRLEAYPFEGLTVAGVVQLSVGPRRENVKDRYEADLRLVRGPFLFQAEYIRAHDLDQTGKAIDGHGFYAAVAWTFFEVLQPAVRVGFLDPQLDGEPGAKGEVWHFDAGLNVLVLRNLAKVQLAYSRSQFSDRTPADELVLVGQVSL